MTKCGECVYNRRDWTNPKNLDYYCGNEDSDNYGYNTAYSDGCENWRAKNGSRCDRVKKTKLPKNHITAIIAVRSSKKARNIPTRRTSFMALFTNGIYILPVPVSHLLSGIMLILTMG